MKLSLIRGLSEGQRLLTRADPLDLSSLPEPVVARTRQVFGEEVTPAQSVVRMLEDVRQQGDAALRRYARLLDGAELSELRVTNAQVRKAKAQLPDGLRRALELAADRVTEFHRATLRKSWVDRKRGLGELVRPLQRVGLYAPGGTAAYPSTVLMTAIPARVAGVEEIILATPRRVRRR